MNRHTKTVGTGVLLVMKRNVMFVLLGAVALAALVVLFVTSTKPKPGNATQVVITTNGQVTLVPAENHFKATIVATLPKTNSTTGTLTNK
ncbi:MAG TPA: hypothetical protein VK615_05705 [Candidatus Binatia bacterium]|nr:hypothetical protein [Candidatus Binatia bacterium]